MIDKKYLEGNKLIAETMGAILHKNWTSAIYQTPADTYEFVNGYPTTHAARFWSPDQLQYHSDISWLKPVVDHLSKAIGFESIDNCKEDEWYILTRFTGMKFIDPVDSVFFAVVAVIKWNNKNKKYNFSKKQVIS